MKLLFDFGGVLTDLDKARVLSSFDALGIDIRPWLGAYKQSGPLELIERGEITVHQFCDEFRRLQPALTDAQIIGAWESFLPGVPPERLDLLLKMRQHYSVNLLSNTNAIHWRMAEEQFFRYKGLSVEDFFDRMFLSFRMGVEKPEPEIFHRIIAAMGGNADEIVFFDDSEANCAAARSCGMRALLAGPESEWFKYFDNDGKLLLA